MQTNFAPFHSFPTRVSGGQHDIRVGIAVVGRFHAFDMARELQKHNLLGQLLSTYPAWITARWGIDRDKIMGEPVLELLRRFWFSPEIGQTA